MQDPGTPVSPDPLARNLPGLPFRSENVRVDEAGIHITTKKKPSSQSGKPTPYESSVAWADIEDLLPNSHSALQLIGHRPHSNKLYLLGIVEPDHEVHAKIRCAWREYDVRRLVQNKELLGHYLPRTGASVTSFLYGGSFIVLSALNCWILLKDEKALQFAKLYDLFLGMTLSFLILGVLSILLGIYHHKRMMKGAFTWKSWKLSRYGLACSPDGKERLLALSDKDWTNSFQASISGMRLIMQEMTHSEVAPSLIFSMIEKASGQFRPTPAIRPLRVLYALSLAVVLGQLAVYIISIPFIPPTKLITFTLIFGFVALASSPLLYDYCRYKISLRNCARYRKLGRSLLERLQW